MGTEGSGTSVPRKGQNEVKIAIPSKGVRYLRPRGGAAIKKKGWYKHGKVITS